MKKIIVRWVKEQGLGYEEAMRVVESDHERFLAGTRFDFGFFSIATREGYTILSLPLKEEYESGERFRPICPRCGSIMEPVNVFHSAAEDDLHAWTCECGEQLDGEDILK